MSQRVVPPDWLGPARIERVVCHWTAGAYLASRLDREHYHVILQDDQALRRGDDAKAIRGLYTPADNDQTGDGKYAAHVAGLNTGSFGLSVACMAGAVQGRASGLFPLTRLLWERQAEAAAEVCHVYELDVTERTVLFHSEVERVYGKPQRGKWDIDFLPFDRDLSPAEVHAQFRRKVNWYLHRLRSGA